MVDYYDDPDQFELDFDSMYGTDLDFDNVDGTDLDEISRLLGCPECGDAIVDNECPTCGWPNQEAGCFALT